MLGENIKILRKQKGYSQETLAQQLNVVRQTVSKWEKGISVPDAEMLNSLSELFEVPVSTLLGSKVEEPATETDPRMEEIAKQLAILNEQLANQALRKRKTGKRIIIIIASVIVGFILLCFLYIGALILFRYHVAENTNYYKTVIQCELNGETYGYEMIYDDNYRIHAEGGDAFVIDHVSLTQYDDYNEQIAHIEDYFNDHGGSVTIITNRQPVASIND